jgi:hypothetical protein
VRQNRPAQPRAGRSLSVLLAGFAAFLGVALPVAGTSSVGLSTLGAQRFGRAALPNANPTGEDYFGYSMAVGDFNGDGTDDLAASAMGNHGPGAVLDGCGEVIVRYGIPGRGLDAVSPPLVLGQFIGGDAENYDRFGEALAACDVNGDGFDDLLVGVPLEDLTVAGVDYVDAGVFSLYWGSAAGLAPTPALTVGEYNALGRPTARVNFGSPLACGDFNGDTFDDVAVGVPYHNVGTAAGAGHVHIYPGTATGFGPHYILSQDSTGIEDVAEELDRFGASLAVGDFDIDGIEDLAVGVKNEHEGAEFRPLVQVIFGTPTRLGATGRDQVIPPLTFDLSNSWGSSLAVGDFDGDYYPDLVVGVPDYSLGSTNDGSAIVFGNMFGEFGAASFRVLYSNGLFGQGASAPGEHFSRALTVGDFDGDGRADLASGIPGQDVEGPHEGAVAVVCGEPDVGLPASSGRARQFNHGRHGVPSGSDIDSVSWGTTLASGDFDGDGYADLAVGTWAEGDGALVLVGSVTVLYGALFADGFEAGLMFW